MTKNNLYIWGPTNLQINKIILPAYTDLSKKCVANIKHLDCPPQYIADMLRNLTEAIMSSYPKFTGNVLIYSFFNE